MNRSLAFLLSGALAVAAVTSACGDGPDPTPTPTSPPVSPTAAGVATRTPSPDASQATGMSKAEFDALENIETSDTGVRWADVVVGTGPTPTSESQVTLHYTGSLAASGIKFQSSKDGGGQPLTLGAGQFIPGFSEAILGMAEGGTRIVFIPSERGYGAVPQSGIPANSDLIFEIELLSVE